MSPLSRRACLAGLAGCVLPAWAGDAGVRLAAAWQGPGGQRHRVGVIDLRQGAGRVAAWLDVPSRAHGVAAETGGSLVFVARRPGDWLVRWHPRTGRTQWLWSEPDRCFTGHVLAPASGRWLYSVETDLESGAGLVVVRDRATWAVQAEWSTGGIDPHQMVADADDTLLVANGGVPTQPETGRAKRDLDRMDPSLVRLDPHSGKRLGQWRLHDPRLSIRHLARHAQGPVGVALQAEHDDPGVKAGAPVLAVFDGRCLRSVPAPQPLAGYGGDIAATAAGFAVSVPRAGGMAHWALDGNWLGLAALQGACALAPVAGGVWAGGPDRAAHWVAATVAAYKLPPLRLDNHWVVL